MAEVDHLVPGVRPETGEAASLEETAEVVVEKETEGEGPAEDPDIPQTHQSLVATGTTSMATKVGTVFPLIPAPGSTSASPDNEVPASLTEEKRKKMIFFTTSSFRV